MNNDFNGEYGEICLEKLQYFLQKKIKRYMINFMTMSLLLMNISKRNAEVICQIILVAIKKYNYFCLLVALVIEAILYLNEKNTPVNSVDLKALNQFGRI